MAAIDLLKELFERDIRFAKWDEDVKVDDTDPGKIDVRFYTDTNEYTLTVLSETDERAFIDATVRSRKARAGQTAMRTRRLLAPGRIRLNARTWQRIIASIVGLELVRLHRRTTAADTNELEESVTGDSHAEAC